MLICKKCDKEYNPSLKFCPQCGSELIEKEAIIVEELSDEKQCKNCGATIVDGAKFCLQCGDSLDVKETNVNSEEVRTQEINNSCEWKKRFQEDLTCAFRSNKFFEFFWKYATAFALYYPVYLIFSRIEGLGNLVVSLDYISVLGFYAYCIGLVALFSKKNYLMMLMSLGIRLLNSLIIVFQTEMPISSICRIIVLAPVFFFLVKEYQSSQH